MDFLRQREGRLGLRGSAHLADDDRQKVREVGSLGQFTGKQVEGGGALLATLAARRLPGYTLAFETLFGLPDERLTIRHDAGTGARPYVAGTLLAAERVLKVQGLIRGLDSLLFRE